MSVTHDTPSLQSIDPSYLSLIARLPLAPLRTEDQYDEAIALLDDLSDRASLTPGEEDYLDVLVDLVERWEDDNVQLPTISGRAVLAVLMEERDLRQKDLIPIFGSKSVVSEVLSGKRPFTLAQIRKLGSFFHVSPELFIPEDDAQVADAE